MSTESMLPSNHLILCCSLLLPSIFPSIRIFSNKLALPIRWPWYWSFSLSISPSNEYSGLISFRIDWFDLLAVKGTLKSLLQHHSLKVWKGKKCLYSLPQTLYPYWIAAWMCSILLKGRKWKSPDIILELFSISSLNSVNVCFIDFWVLLFRCIYS